MLYLSSNYLFLINRLKRISIFVKEHFLATKKPAFGGVNLKITIIFQLPQPTFNVKAIALKNNGKNLL